MAVDQKDGRMLVVVMEEEEKCRVQCFTLLCFASASALLALSLRRKLAQGCRVGESSRPPLAKLYLRSRAAYSIPSLYLLYKYHTIK